MKRLIRQLKWRWILIGALLIIGRFTLVWAGNVSSSIEDTGTNVGIGTTSPTQKLEVAGGNIRIDGGNLLQLLDSTGAQGSAIFETLVNGQGVLNFGNTSKTSFFSINTITGAITVPQFIIPDSTGAQGSAIFETLVNGQGVLNFGNTSGTSYLSVNTNTGNVGIGTTSPMTKLHIAGDAQVDGNLAAKYQDVAEWVQASSPLSPGTVVVVDPQERNQVLPASQSYDTRVAGVVSSRPGILLGEAGPDKVRVAQSGRVKVKVDATYEPIAAGDLLVTSPTPGHAMRSMPVDLGGVLIHRAGTLLGKALEPLEGGQGEILVLLTLQ